MIASQLRGELARLLREEVMEALDRAGLAPTLVNGAGTGSLRTAAREPRLTELTAGSGFLCPHLFDYYESLVASA